MIRVDPEASMKIAENQALRSPLQRIGQWFVQVTSRRLELRVWQTRSRDRWYWRAYDPLSGQAACFGTEAEMRLWIEQQYSR